MKSTARVDEESLHVGYDGNQQGALLSRKGEQLQYQSMHANT